MRQLFALFLATALLSLGGCATLQAPLSNQPVDRDHGSRTWGSFFEDAAIEHKVEVNLKRMLPKTANPHIVVVSFNGLVLLAGEVHSKDIKVQAGQIAKRIRHVNHVYNELKLSGNISWLAGINDAWITSKVKTGLFFNGNAPGWRTKVVTENGVVYLMGLLTHEEAKQVVRSVQDTGGVQKIIKIIQYIDE